MIFSELPLKGAYRVDLDRRVDERGFFARLYCAREFAEQGLDFRPVQVNDSFSALTGTVRGLHFQRHPWIEAKLVRCLKGAIFDVIVDLRARSETFGQWTALTLDAEERTMIYIPPGFAHGFQTLAPETELLYFHSEVHAPGHEGGLAHDDPALAIAWPLDVTALSARDAAFPQLADLSPL